MTRTISVTRLFAFILGLALLSACQSDSREQLLKTGKSQVALRSIQSRVFDTSDRKKTLRTVIATMQDLGFVVDKADAILGSVSGTKFDKTTFSLPYRLRMTVTVRPRGETQLMVRANAQYNITPVEDPKPYQNFFNALSKAMFLEANLIEGGVAAGGFTGQAPSQATAAPTIAPGRDDATKDAAAVPLPPGSIIDFEKDRSKIEQAIIDFYDTGGYSSDTIPDSLQVHGVELVSMASVKHHSTTGDKVTVIAAYKVVGTYRNEQLTRTSNFVLKKNDGMYRVIEFKPLGA